MSNVIWTPQPKQIQMMQRPEYEGFYGGAAGGGKSDYLLAEALRQVHIPHYMGIIFRKTYPQLSELIDRSRWLYSRAFPGAKYNSTEHCWYFPSGAKIYFGNLNRPADKINYQGKRYDFIGFDELTHFTWEEYSYLYSRNRPSGKGTRVYRRATGNPGGIGHGWVKQYFVKAGPPYKPIKTTVTIIGPDGQLIELSRKKIFIPSSVFDNQALLESDPNYLANLAMMSQQDKDALLYGDWDSFAGQVFMEWRDDPAAYGSQKWTHVIDDFDIPKDWKIYRGFDFGYSKPFSVGWYALDHDGRLYRFRECYGCTETPNTGIKIHPQEIAQRIRDIESTDYNIRGRHVTGIADPSIYDKSRGESVAEMMEKCGVYFDKADNTRIAGKMQFHYRFAFDEIGMPMLYIFKSCTQFIRTIPSLVYDEKKVEDIDTTQEDHIYDECRYVLMEHPLNPRRNVLQTPPKDDPLDLFKKERQYDRYEFYRQ
nr:MAG: terminase large subunit [Caudoviricetes sp.]